MLLASSANTGGGGEEGKPAVLPAGLRKREDGNIFPLSHEDIFVCFSPLGSDVFQADIAIGAA
jgi:hypothetical protein